MLIANRQGGKSRSIVYFKFPKDIAQVSSDGSCSETELPPDHFVWQSRGYQPSNLALAFCKHGERLLGLVRCGGRVSERGRLYGQSPSGRDLPQVVD
jgi:hypothetical protein